MKKFAIFACLSLMAIISVMPAIAQEKVTITWFVGLGTGTQAEQIEAQNQLVADFNASQDEIELVINIAGSNETARDTLATLIAAGQAPDIVGPVGVGGANAYQDQWADLTALVESSGFDMSVFDPALIDLYRSGDELLGIPFAVFPSLMYYSTDLFDEAGLEYPPAEFGAPYILNGEEVAWDYNTITEIAKILTVDANGNDATSADFDANNIVQFGFNMQWARIALQLTDLQPEVLYNAETNSVTIPESWRTGAEWLQAGVWEHHFIPTATYDGSELLGGNAFSTGNVAMAVTPLWYTCCLANSIDNFEWDLAVVPRSLDGEYHVATDADTFRLTKSSQHPEEAFTVLSYLLTEGVPVLTGTYGAYPAHSAYQQPFIDGKAAQYPFVTNWDVVAASLAYNNPGNKHHEAWLPNWQKATDRLDAFNSLLYGETGGTIDVQAELDTVEADLNSIINE